MKLSAVLATMLPGPLQGRLNEMKLAQTSYAAMAKEVSRRQAGKAAGASVAAHQGCGSIRAVAAGHAHWLAGGWLYTRLSHICADHASAQLPWCPRL